MHAPKSSRRQTVLLRPHNSVHSLSEPEYCCVWSKLSEFGATDMAAARVIAVGNTTSSLLLKGSRRLSQKPHGVSPCFNRLLSKKRLFNCSALYKPQVQIKEEGQFETFDYRVYLVDNSGRKVPFVFSYPFSHSLFSQQCGFCYFMI